jgi:anti-anti-sigma factor
MTMANDDGCQVVKLQSRFSHETTSAFLKKVAAALEGGATKLVVDFSETVSVDSAAIGTLASVIKDCKLRGTDIVLKNLNAEMYVLFTDTGFDRLVAIESPCGVRGPDPFMVENAMDVRLFIEKQTAGDVRILLLSGIMNNPQGSQYFREEFLLEMTTFRKILLDMSNLTLFDSLSTGVVLSMNRLLNETGGSMRISGCNDMVNDLFSSLNLHHIISYFPTREEALKDW